MKLNLKFNEIFFILIVLQATPAASHRWVPDTGDITIWTFSASDRGDQNVARCQRWSAHVHTGRASQLQFSKEPLHSN